MVEQQNGCMFGSTNLMKLEPITTPSMQTLKLAGVPQKQRYLILKKNKSSQGRPSVFFGWSNPQKNSLKLPQD